MITKQQLSQRARNSNPLKVGWLGWGLALVEAASVYRLGLQAGWWWLAGLIVVAIEMRGLYDPKLSRDKRLTIFWERLPGVMMGLGVTLIIAVVPRQATQVVVAVLYLAWLLWREFRPAFVSTFANTLLIQAVIFEAVFLVAAIWQTPSWAVLMMVWAGAYFGVYGVLRQRGDRSAGVMAATWGVIAVEVSWVLMLWLITYTMNGGYVLVPQPALILTALAYVFGSILASSRQGILSRARLGEYMVIALILVVIVISGTSWKGSV